MYTGTLKKGDKLTIEREYELGKTGTEIVTVVGIFQEGKTRFALMDNNPMSMGSFLVTYLLLSK